MRKVKIVGFLYFSLYTQLWNEGQSWGCSHCPFLPQRSCYCELQTAQCFCKRDFTLALSVSLKEFTVSLKGPLEILDTNKLLKKYSTGEKTERQIFGICITKRKLIFFIKFMRLYSCVYMEHDKSQGPVAILPRKLLMIKSSWEAGSVPGMCIRDGGMLLAPVELGWIRRWCNPVEIWPQSAREQKCLRCIFYCRLTK